jgi:hypothetical protein
MFIVDCFWLIALNDQIYFKRWKEDELLQVERMFNKDERYLTLIPSPIEREARQI